MNIRMKLWTYIYSDFDKPLNIERLYSGLDRAMEYLDESYIEIYLENDSRHIKVPVDDIKYIKRENRKILFLRITEIIPCIADLRNW